MVNSMRIVIELPPGFAAKAKQTLSDEEPGSGDVLLISVLPVVDVKVEPDASPAKQGEGATT
jgi:hypothetical protein